MSENQLDVVLSAVICDVLSMARTTLPPGTLIVEELGADSLDLLEIADRVSRRFHIEFSDNDIVSASIFGSLSSLRKAVLERAKVDE